MTQSDFGNIDANVNNGTQLASMLNNWRNAVHTTHSGAARPSYVQPGQLWISTAGGATNWLLNLYLGATVGDKPIATIDSTTGIIKLNGDASLLTGQPAFASVTAAAGADVPIAPGAGYTSGPSTGSIGAAGQKWRLDAGFIVENTGAGGEFFPLRVWNGAAAVGPTPVVYGGPSQNVYCGYSHILTLGAATTFTMQANVASGSANGHIVNQSWITAERLS